MNSFEKQIDARTLTERAMQYNMLYSTIRRL